MTSVLSSVRDLMHMFDNKQKEFLDQIDNVHMVWLDEIQQEATRIFSRDYIAGPGLMPKTPSQKKNSRRKRVSLGHQEQNPGTRRYSRGKRSHLRGSSVKALNLITEEETIPEVSEVENRRQPKRATRKNKKKNAEGVEDDSISIYDSSQTEEVQTNETEPPAEEEKKGAEVLVGNESEDAHGTSQSAVRTSLSEVAVHISAEERSSAELAKKPEASPGRSAAKMATAETPPSSRPRSARYSLKLRHSVAGLRHSMTQESVRRASRRSMLKKKAVCTGNSSNSEDIGADSSMDTSDEGEENRKKAAPVDSADGKALEKAEISEIKKSQSVHAAVERVTRSVAANSPKLAPPPLFTSEVKMSTPVKKTVSGEKSHAKAIKRLSIKRKAPDTVEDSPTKRFSPPKRSQSTVKPNMRSFLHTVQKNQLLMMTPNSLSRSAVIKSFIKHTTPLKVDPKMNMGTVMRERNKLEALKKKQEQEEERMKKMEEEKKRKQEELKRKREERIRRVFEAKVKEEQREEQKKKKIEQKMAQIDEKNDKRLAEDKAKKKVALKRQEELEQKKKMEQEEEKRQQELAAKKKAEEEELKKEQERERRAAAERERLEKEKAQALQRELERAAREKEKREEEEKRRALLEKQRLQEEKEQQAKERVLKEKEEAKQREAAQNRAFLLNKTIEVEGSILSTPVGKGAGLNVTVDLTTMTSPQSYSITPKGHDKPKIISETLDNYGMDQNSDDSTDDESAPRKPIPSWAEGPNLRQIIMKQYFDPPDFESFFGTIEPLKLENIFYKSKPRYFKRTSSAVWHSPPAGAK